ncbi:aminotransferase class III-fold pyridoxal phosphate-dependent enzyme [Candidatus Peregrinibacteria bacterium]|nr:aminotransferase class III-fold pyridoxal phosphate-dependent enzyme [Candidatus Peregrinibacteria bacterium]
MINTYARYPVKLVKGRGSYVYDDQGKKYLDFYGGHAVCLLGHCNPKIVKAINDQSKKLIFYSNIFETEPAAILAEKLAKTLLPKKYKVYFANSGSEANETAIKIVRKHTGKHRIISFKDSFHGRSAICTSATGIDSYHQFEPNFDSYTSFAILGDMKSVKKAAGNNTAAVICEPIQSIGGINLANASFYKQLAAFCKRKNIILIFDEIQTGLGRTGNFWFSKSMGVYPDIITTAKGIAGGLPLSAVLVKELISREIKTGQHATTFGGGPVVCAAGIATVNILTQKNFLKKVKEKSKYLVKKLKKIDGIKNVLGSGFLLGIEFSREFPNLTKTCLRNGLIIGSSYKKNVFRIMPPLTTNKSEIDEFLRLFEKSLASVL